MNTALVIIGLSMLIFLVVFYLKRAKEKRKAWLEEREKNKYYGEHTFYYWFWKNVMAKIDDNTWVGFCGYRHHWAKDKSNESVMVFNHITLE